MKKILVQFSSPVYANNNIFNKKDINNQYVAWFELKRKMKEIGYELMTADNNNLTDCEGIIFFNADSLYEPLSLYNKLKNAIKKVIGVKVEEQYPSRNLYMEAINSNLKDKLLLVLWEGKAICEKNFKSCTLNKFNHILTWDEDLLNDPKFTHLYIPMEGNEVLSNLINFSAKKLLTNISFNKYSSYKNELYSARRRTIEYFDKNFPNDFDLYGLRWNRPVTRLQIIFPFLVKKFITYRGHAANKLETLSKYKFNLAYENISDAKGYIADRIFTTLHSKSIPIYWGATNIDSYIDKDVFIDRRQFKNDAELAIFLRNMKEEEYNKYLDAASRYMLSEKYAKFLPENFSTQVIKALQIKEIKTEKNPHHEN